MQKSRIFTAMLLSFSITLIGLTAQAFDRHQSKGVALVYDGPGNCEDGCAEAAADIAKQAGFTPRMVKPDALPENATAEQVKELFSDAKVWIQPGGIANESMYTMTEKLTAEIVNFVKNGGGYVGFCAGAFMSTNPIGGTRDYGLGLFPGRTYPFKGYWAARRDLNYGLATVTWLGQTREIFMQGGPYFYGYENDKNVEVIAQYATGLTAAARTTFGKGRVFVTGLHPEAPSSWTEEDDFKDPDGNEQFLAISMVHWVTDTETKAEKKAVRDYFKKLKDAEAEKAKPAAQDSTRTSSKEPSVESYRRFVQY